MALASYEQPDNVDTLLAALIAGGFSIQTFEAKDAQKAIKEELDQDMNNLETWTALQDGINLGYLVVNRLGQYKLTEKGNRRGTEVLGYMDTGLDDFGIQSVQEISKGRDYKATDLDRVIKLYYTSLRDNTLGEVPRVIERIIKDINNMAQDQAQADFFYDYIMNGIVKLAMAEKRMNVIQRLKDMAKIMRTGLGKHEPGLNEQG